MIPSPVLPMDAGPSSTSPVPDSNLAGDFLTPGEKFGDFQIMQCLSFGLTGGFYRMQHIREFHEVSVLVIPRRAGLEPGFEQRFEKFASTLQHFEHPNAVKVIGTGRIKERFCLFTELIEGVNVNDYMEEYLRQTLLQSGGSTPEVEVEPDPLAEPVDEEALNDKQFGLPPPVVKGIMVQATSAVKAALDIGLHHFGLNPTSMILTPDGQIKVFGFGLMEILGKDLFEQVVSQGIPPITIGRRRVVINTVDTLSPEVRAGGAPDARSDLFALGLCGYFLLTGHKPTLPPRSPSEFSAAIPGTWDRILLRCLEVDPARRPATAAQLQSEFERVDAQAGDPGEAGLEWLVRRVPVPGTLVRRLKPSSLRLLRLSILGLFAVMAMGAAVSSIFVLFAPDSSTREAVVFKAQPGEPPRVQMQIRPERARAVFRTGDTLSTVDGKLDLVMPPGEYEVTVDSPNHKPSRLTLKVERTAQVVAVTLDPLWAWLEAKAPPGTRILAITERGVETVAGIVPESGLLVARETVYTGTYTIRAERENYRPAEQKAVKLELNKPLALDFQLDPLPGSVVVRTDPPGAVVYLNRREVGRTPVTVPDLGVQRDLRIDVVLDRYRPFTQVLQLEPGEQRVFELGELTRKTGAIAVEVSFEGVVGAAAAALRREALIRVGDRSVSAEARALDVVDEGEQTLEVVHPDYVPYRELVEVLDRETVRRLVTLAPRPGLLTVEATPAAPFKLLANGREVPNQGAVFAVPPGVDVALEVRAPDFLVARRTLTIQPNDRQTWAVALVPIPSPEEGQPWVVPYVGTRLVPVPTGEFTWGSPPEESERLADEGPQTRVRFARSFWIGAFEITQAEYEAVMGRNPSGFPGADRPVESISWADAMAFADRITERERRAGRLPTGFVYRLPTEAEWEYAARAGATTPFQWGDQADGSQGNFKGRYPREFGSATTSGDDRYGTMPVGQFAPNAWGLYDVHGNVREWTWDRFNARLPGGTVEGYAGPDTGSTRSIRGGGWEDFAHRCRFSARERRGAANIGTSVGFRLALGPELSR